jgi:hypothetical protein
MPDQPTLSSNTPIRLALVLGFLGVFAAAVWWAAGVSAALKSIVSSEVINANSIIEIKASNLVEERDIADLKLKLALNVQEIEALKTKKP